MTDLRACAWLTGSLVRRLLREGLVVRSLVWPSALAVGVLLLTLGVVGLMAASGTVAVVAGSPPEVRQAAASDGWALIEARDASHAASLVHRGDVWAATDGATIWQRGESAEGLALEAKLRDLRGSGWLPRPANQAQEADEAAVAGGRIVRLLLPLFALYGVVFGLGMVARDRDDGTLDAELSLPMARWVPGAARWTAGTAVLTVFIAYSVALFDAVMGVDDAGALVRNGSAAAGGAMAVGIGVAGRAGMRQGFSGPLAFALTLAAGLMALGAASPAVGRWLPLASLGAGGDGWVPGLLALGCGALASAGFAWRSARS